MPTIDSGDVGAWFTVQKTYVDKVLHLGERAYCVSLDKSADFESWRPYLVSIHELCSEGGSCYMSLFTFRTKFDAEVFYDYLESDTLVSKLP